VSLAITKGLDMLDFIIVFIFVLGVAGFSLFIAEMIATILNKKLKG
jgi:hypothetical protein